MLPIIFNKKSCFCVKTGNLMPTRHLDTGIYDYDFARLDHWVLCPDCGAVGLLHRRACGCRVFYYRQCGKSLDSHYQHQHRLINYSRNVFRYYVDCGRFRCYHCGGKWLRGSHYLPNVGRTPKEFPPPAPYVVITVCIMRWTLSTMSMPTMTAIWV